MDQNTREIIRAIRETRTSSEWKYRYLYRVRPTVLFLPVAFMALYLVAVWLSNGGR
jgi:hypothetical protein